MNEWKKDANLKRGGKGIKKKKKRGRKFQKGN